MMSEAAEPSSGIAKLPKNVIWLGFASLFNDIASELLLRTLPLFLSGYLGVSMSIIGLIEGVSEAASSLLKVVSGWLSDKTGSRKKLTAWGYAFSALSRPILFFAGSWILPFLFRFLDRVGKGIRAAPRDALIADSVPSEMRGRAFGFNRALDPFGAVLGCLIGAAVLYGIGGIDTHPNGVIDPTVFRAIILIALIPTLMATFVVFVLVKENKVRTPSDKSRFAFSFSGLGRPFKRYLAILFIFSLGMSSDAFLLLRASSVGIGPAEIFLMIACFNLVTAVSAYPAAALADKFSRRSILIIGWTYYAILYIGFAFASTALHVWVLFVSYGLYYGLTEGAEKAFVADIVPANSRGTAYGLFNGVIGIAALPASLFAGLLWQNAGVHAPFLFGGFLALSAAAFFFFSFRKK